MSLMWLTLIHPDGAPAPAWLHAEGGVGTLRSGQSSVATVVLPAGAYFIVDTGVDEDNIPFAKAGAARALEVVGSGDGLPTAAAVVTESEYSFSIGNLRAGSATIRVENVGRQVHEFLAAPIVAGRSSRLPLPNSSAIWPQDCATRTDR